ncbi:MAG: hypothetical protein HUK21_11960 [Fibrobacteraceae bacterium]|nr:hypothetical protein [Fibrobacteraceae bacterium]
MKYISLFFLILCSCSTSIINTKGDVFILHTNSNEDYKKYEREVLRLEKIAGMESMRSFNQKGLHVYLYSSAAVNFQFYFVSESLLTEDYFIHNIEGINACGKMVVSDSMRTEIFGYEAENFPYISILRDGRFPLKGDKKTYNHVVGYRLFESGERRYFSYYLFSEERSHAAQRVGFPPYPQIINEYNNFVKSIISLADTTQSSKTCRDMKRDDEKN